MSKARSMYAGSSGYNYGVNKNSPGNGNGKWQGLWPSVGHARNARHINIEAGGNNRNVVFCMNQLGGVGRISNMFATTADGVQDCKNGCILSSNIKEALQQLTNYAGQKGNQLCLVGVKEKLSQDVPGHSGSFDKSFPGHLQRYVHAINNLGLEFAVTGPNDVQRHVVAMVTSPDAKLLRIHGYGFPVKALCNSIIAYGFDCDSFKPSFTFNEKGVTFTFRIKDPDAELYPGGPSKRLLLLVHGIRINNGIVVPEKFYDPTETDKIKVKLKFTGNDGKKYEWSDVHAEKKVVNAFESTNPGQSVEDGLHITPTVLPGPQHNAKVWDFEVFVPIEAMYYRSALTARGPSGSLMPYLTCNGNPFPDPKMRFTYALGTGGGVCDFQTPANYRSKTCF